MDASKYALAKTRDYISLLSSSVCVSDVRHSHQTKVVILRTQLFYALSHYDGLDNTVVLPAFGDRRADGRGYNGAVVFKYHSVDSLRFLATYI